MAFNIPNIDLGGSGYDYIESGDATDIHNSIDSSLITGPKFGCIHYEPKDAHSA